MLPLVANEVTRSTGSGATLVIAACVVVPQAIVAGLSPLVGRTADTWGRLQGFARDDAARGCRNASCAASQCVPQRLARPAFDLDAHTGRAVRRNAEPACRSASQADQPGWTGRAAVVHPHQSLQASFQVGHPGDGRQLQRRMRRGHGSPVVCLAIGRQPRAIRQDGSDPRGVELEVFCRVAPYAPGLIRRPNGVMRTRRLHRLARPASRQQQRRQQQQARDAQTAASPSRPTASA